MKLIYVSLGFLGLIFSVAALILPAVPATPFLILSLYFFTKGSKKIYNYLMSYRHIEEVVSKWKSGKLITLKVKFISILISIISFIIIFLIETFFYLKVITISSGLIFLGFIITRPIEHEDQQ